MHLLLAAMVAALPQAQTVPPPPAGRISAAASDLLNLGTRFENGGQAGTAAGIYRALLADPDRHIRNEARFRLARLHALRSDWAGGAVLLRQILDEDPGAARARLELAGMLDKLGDEAAARRELRAAQAGRPPAPLARLIDRYASALRDRRPFGGALKLALAPDSNINRSTAEDRLQTVIGDFTIGPDGRARSGIGAAVEASAFARRPLSSRLSVIVQGNGHFVRYRQRSFDRLSLGARAGVQLALGRDRLAIAVAHQRHHVGGELRLTSLGLEADGSHPLSRTAQLRASGGVARLDNRQNPLERGTSFGLGAAVDVALSPATGISLSLSGNRRTAHDPAYATRSVELGASGWREFGRVTVGGSASLGRLRADDRFSLLPERRKDRNWAVGVSVTSRHIAIAGLAPSLRFTLERNRSNIAFYDTSRQAVELGVTRAF